MPNLNCCCCSVIQSCLTLCNPMDCSMPGFPLLHHLLELAQTHVQSVMASNNPVLCHPLLLLISIFPSIRLFSNTPISWIFVSGGQSIGVSASASSLSNEYSWLISLRIDWFDLPEVQGTVKSLHQHHSSKASILHAQPSLWSNSH